MTSRHVAALFVSGLALLAPACSSTRVQTVRPQYERPLTAFDEGYRNGLRDGQWAGHRDVGKPMRHDFWRDGRYRQGTEGYRPIFGPRAAYTDGYRAGYEKGYRQRRASERHRDK